MSVSTVDSKIGAQYCNSDICERLQRVASKQCTMCEFNLCVWCARQGFECLDCESYCCRYCESDDDSLKCNQCSK